MFRHKYLRNPPVTHTDNVVDAAKETHNCMMESLEKLSDILLTTTESNKDNRWEEPTKSAYKEPSTVQQVHTPVSQLASMFPNTEIVSLPEQQIQHFKRETDQRRNILE